MKSEEILKKVIGLRKDEAENLALDKEYQIRTIEINGNYLIVSRDYKPLRINIKVKNGIVYDSYFG